MIEYGGEKMVVGSVGVTGGERYYWLLAADGAVSMLPADVLEGIAIKAGAQLVSTEEGQG